MNPITPIDWNPPELGEYHQIHSHLYWHQQPLPMRLNHINLWILPDHDGWTLVDCGLHYPNSHAAWQITLEKLWKTGPIKRIICTHYHPDHAGNAGWLVRQTGAEFYMSEAEWLSAKLLLTVPIQTIGKNMQKLATQSGLDGTRIGELSRLGNHYQIASDGLPDRYHRLADNMVLSINGMEWRVMMGFGHSAEHACLYTPELGLFIGGDHVLLKITPNISTHWFNGWSDPLGGFLQTSDRIIKEVSDDAMVLASHRMPFYGLHQRLTQIKTHHEQRLQDTRDGLRAQPNHSGQAADILPFMFHMELDAFGLMFAIGEAEAHLRHLVARGEAEQIGDKKEIERPWVYRLLG